jgi:hypothetical protein
MNSLQHPRTWTDSLDKRPKPRNMDMRFCTWNIISLYRAGSLVTVSRNFQNIIWEGGGPELTGEHTYFYGKGKENNELGAVFVHTVLPRTCS